MLDGKKQKSTKLPQNCCCSDCGKEMPTLSGLGNQCTSTSCHSHFSHNVPTFSQMSPLFQEPWDIVPNYEISWQNTAKEQADLNLHCLSRWSVRKVRVFTVDILNWIVLRYFIRTNNSILFQQKNIEYWCIEVPKPQKLVLKSKIQFKSLKSQNEVFELEARSVLETASGPVAKHA